VKVLRRNRLGQSFSFFFLYRCSWNRPTPLPEKLSRIPRLRIVNIGSSVLPALSTAAATVLLALFADIQSHTDLTELRIKFSVTMSVKFEKETIKQTGGIAGTQGIDTMRGGKHELAEEIGTALTGGKGNAGTPGYLAVRIRFRKWSTMDTVLTIVLHRPISSSFRRIPFGLRCSHPEPYQLHKNFSRRGSRRTATRMATTSHHECQRWLRTELSSAHLWAMS
jgi:hypothetical protein